MSRTPVITRMIIRITASLFTVIFIKRWRLSIEHIERSSLQLTHHEAHRLARCALEQVGLTALGVMRRALLRDVQLKLDSHSLDDRLRTLELRGIHVEGREYIYEALSSGRGLVIVSAHLGAWEELIALGSWLGRPVQVISKRMRSSIAQRLWDRSRRSMPSRLDQAGSGRVATRSLRAGGVIADVLDQHDPRPQALSLSFLGREAQTSGDLARLALLGDALIVPVFLLRGHLGRAERANLTPPPRPRTLSIGSPIDPRAFQDLDKAELIKTLTQACLTQIEREVLRAPEQWLWLHRRWKPHAQSLDI